MALPWSIEGPVRRRGRSRAKKDNSRPRACLGAEPAAAEPAAALRADRLLTPIAPHADALLTPTACNAEGRTRRRHATRTDCSRQRLHTPTARARQRHTHAEPPSSPRCTRRPRGARGSGRGTGVRPHPVSCFFLRGRRACALGGARGCGKKAHPQEGPSGRRVFAPCPAGTPPRPRSPRRPAKTQQIRCRSRRPRRLGVMNPVG